jgi:hypothetical protein
MNKLCAPIVVVPPPPKKKKKVLRGILENTEYSLEIPVAKHRG